MKAKYIAAILGAFSVLLLLLSLAFFQNYTAMKGMVVDQQKTIDQQTENNARLIQMMQDSLAKKQPVY